MMTETKLSTNKTMAQRIKDREANSGAGANPHVSVKQGEGARRNYTNIHYSPNLTRGGDKGER
jgi:hypothetical protein